MDRTFAVAVEDWHVFKCEVCAGCLSISRVATVSCDNNSREDYLCKSSAGFSRDTCTTHFK